MDDDIMKAGLATPTSIYGQHADDAGAERGGVTGMTVRAGYFAEFDAFCRCYPDREERLSQVLAEAVRGTARGCDRALRILDVGSADGRLLSALVARLDRAPASITCLEPCPEGFRRLQQDARALAAQVELHEETVDAWLRSQSTETEPFDLVICSHVHYHFEDPAELTHRLGHFVSPSGALVAIIDSHDSPIYRWLDTVDSDSARTSRYGAFFGFEHLRSALREQELPHTFGIIDSTLTFPAISDFSHAVGFLGRRTVVEGITHERRPRWAETFPCTVAWREGFVVLRGALSPRMSI